MPKRASNGWKWGASGSFRCRWTLLLEFSPGWLHLSGMTRAGNPAPRDQNPTANWDLKVFWVLCTCIHQNRLLCCVVMETIHQIKWLHQFTPPSHHSSDSSRWEILLDKPPGTWLAEVWLQAPLAASEGKKIGESHIRCTFLTQKWHRSHFTCITWATTDPWLLLGRGLLGSREQKE